MINAGGKLRAMGAGISMLALLACTPPAAITVAQPPQSRPAPVLAVAPAPQPATPSAASEKLRVYYKRLENDLVTRGLLRGDGGGPDTPFTDTQLAQNFVQIALFDEYVADGDLLRAKATASTLRRWDRPVRIATNFGPSITAEQRATDQEAVTDYAARLARVSGHPISVSDRNPNFHVLFLSEDDRQSAEDQIRALIPGIENASLRAILTMPRDQLCIVVAFSKDGQSAYSNALAVIRGEHPDLLRRSCIHEELAQGLGLANDSPRARPSIFNDDEEFGLLTTHDELLLRMLYDKRLRIGMDATQAAPIARTIATELTGGSAS